MAKKPPLVRRLVAAAAVLLTSSLGPIRAASAEDCLEITSPVQPPISIGSNLEMFVDRHLIARLAGARLSLHKPEFAGIVMTLEKPWEGGGTGFFTILRDGPIYRMYYVGIPLTDPNDDLDSYPCYAESRDGITWAKPDLGLCSFNGSAKNNILMLPSEVEPYPTNFAPFIDEKPGLPREERFKAVGAACGPKWRPGRDPRTKEGMWLLVSPDGIHWRKRQEAPILLPHAVLGSDGHDDFDMQNCAFWSAAEKRYVLYYRIATDAPASALISGAKGCRNIARTTSDDLIHWTTPQRMSYGNTELEQLYTIATFPYFRAPQIYLSFPMRFVHGRRFLSEAQWKALPVLPLYRDSDTANEISDSVFMTSRGGTRYDRTFMEAFLRPGPDLGNWVSRDGMSARGLVQTGPYEISIYHQSHFAQSDAYLGRYVVRLDGFASVNAPYQGGEMLTKPLIVAGRGLMLNFSTSAPGSIRVEVEEPDGEPIPGFSLQECRDLVGDSVEYEVRWGRHDDLTSLAGRPVRLRFVMKDADLYSIRFR